MLDTMPYADLLAIYNALTEKPVTRFDTRANGVRRTEALLEARGLSLAEAARLADVVLPGVNVCRAALPADETVQEPSDTAVLARCPKDDADGTQSGADVGHDAEPIEANGGATILVDPGINPAVQAFARELMKPARPAYVAAFLRRLNAGGGAPVTTTKRQGGITPSQRKIVDLCSRPEGATGKELAEGCGWPSIAARATCQKIAERFDYVLHESPKANGRGISFRLTAKPVEE